MFGDAHLEPGAIYIEHANVSRLAGPEGKTPPDRERVGEGRDQDVDVMATVKLRDRVAFPGAPIPRWSCASANRNRT
jgi:hypothetical protein